jgi:hypothetical protein
LREKKIAVKPLEPSFQNGLRPVRRVNSPDRCLGFAFSNLQPIIFDRNIIAPEPENFDRPHTGFRDQRGDVGQLRRTSQKISLFLFFRDHVKTQIGQLSIQDVLWK